MIPYDTHSPTKLLNYLTAPDCVIYTAGPSPFGLVENRKLTRERAVIASAAVPGILNPVVLMTKDANGVCHPCVQFSLPSSEIASADHVGAQVGVPGQAQGRQPARRHPSPSVSYSLSTLPPTNPDVLAPQNRCT